MYNRPDQVRKTWGRTADYIKGWKWLQKPTLLAHIPLVSRQWRSTDTILTVRQSLMPKIHKSSGKDSNSLMIYIHLSTIPGLGSLKQEHKFRPSPGYILRPCFEKLETSPMACFMNSINNSNLSASSVLFGHVKFINYRNCTGKSI